MKESDQTPDATKKQVSRRRLVQAGLIAVPVLMTLPTTPAWGVVAPSTGSTCRNPGALPQTQSCAILDKGNGGTPGQAGPDAFNQNPFSGSALENPFK